MVRPLNASVQRGPKERAGGEQERGVNPPLVRGVRGFSLEKIFKFKMSVEAILMHSETMFTCEIRLIVQALNVAVLKRVLNATTK